MLTLASGSEQRAALFAGDFAENMTLLQVRTSRFAATTAVTNLPRARAPLPTAAQNYPPTDLDRLLSTANTIRNEVARLRGTGEWDRGASLQLFGEEERAGLAGVSRQAAELGQQLASSANAAITSLSTRMRTLLE